MSDRRRNDVDGAGGVVAVILLVAVALVAVVVVLPAYLLLWGCRTVTLWHRDARPSLRALGLAGSARLVGALLVVPVAAVWLFLIPSHVADSVRHSEELPRATGSPLVYAREVRELGFRDVVVVATEGSSAPVVRDASCRIARVRPEAGGQARTDRRVTVWAHCEQPRG